MVPSSFSSAVFVGYNDSSCCLRSVLLYIHHNALCLPPRLLYPPVPLTHNQSEVTSHLSHLVPRHSTSTRSTTLLLLKQHIFFFSRRCVDCDMAGKQYPSSMGDRRDRDSLHLLCVHIEVSLHQSDHSSVPRSEIESEEKQIFH